MGVHEYSEKNHDAIFTRVKHGHNQNINSNILAQTKRKYLHAKLKAQYFR